MSARCATLFTGECEVCGDVVESWDYYPPRWLCRDCGFPDPSEAVI